MTEREEIEAALAAIERLELRQSLGINLSILVKAARAHLASLRAPASADGGATVRMLRYVEQLEAHMDEDGKTGPNNVRDLIQMVRELAALPAAPAAPVAGEDVGAQIEAAADRIIATMFAPHELPLDDELWTKYCATARAAIAPLIAENARLRSELTDYKLGFATQTEGREAAERQLLERDADCFNACATAEARADAAEAKLGQMREALEKAERALDVAEVVVDADAEVTAFSLIQDTRRIVRAVLASAEKATPLPAPSPASER